MKKKNENNKKRVLSSFRDPSGFLFFEGNVLYRQINGAYQEYYDHLINSGLFKKLIQNDLLVMHAEVDMKRRFSEEAYRIIQPEIIPFISYPYEWCFSQLKDAALLTLQIQKYALEFGMTLKDASSYNIQFSHGKPKLIDTLSFEVYKEGSPWIAYRQFCQHFLAPLALMSYRDVRLAQLLRVYIDGIPLDLASSLLPLRSLLNLSLCAHIRFHAGMQHRLPEKGQHPRVPFLSKRGLFALIDNLESLILSLRWEPKGTEWANYYSETNYSVQAFQDKKNIIQEFLKVVRSDQCVWDIGGNVGIFSRIAGNKGIFTVCFDSDSAAIEKNYLEVKSKKERTIFPLVLDITNPSPAIGWANQERGSMEERGPANIVFALALLHHLAISNNLPFSDIAQFFSVIGESLVVEFVPREDSQVQRMLLTRQNDFPDYTLGNFERAFQKYFSIKSRRPIKDSKRILYYMKKI